MYLLKPTKKPSKHLSMTEACKCNCQFHLLTFKKRGQEEVQMDDFQSNHHPLISKEMLQRKPESRKWTRSLSVLVYGVCVYAVFVSVFLHFLLASVAVLKHNLICTFNLSNLLSSLCVQMIDLVVFHLHLTKRCGFLKKSGINTITHAHRHTRTRLHDNKRMLFVLEQSVLVMRLSVARRRDK